MGWVRENRRFGGALALLALVFQLVFAFGHVHAPGHGTAAGVTLAAHDDGASGHHDEPSAPAGAACELCAIFHMAAAGQVAETPALIHPAAFAPVARPALADLAITPSRQFLPQSRAPPIV